MTNTKKIILIIVIILLAVGVGYYIYRDLNVKHSVSNTVGNLVSDKTETEKLVSAPVPNLDRKIPAGTSQSVTDKINDLSAKLKENNNLFSYWLELGIYRKSAKDYDGAIEAWEYASVLNPGSSVPFNNIGDLYAYFIKDSAKAEEYLLKAIETEPHYAYGYYKMAEVYIEVIKDTGKAKNILREGIKANPNTSQDLQKNLNTLNSL